MKSIPYIIATCFGLLSSYFITVISGVIFFLEKDFSFTSFQQGALVSSALLGTLFGIALATLFSDRIRRKTLLLVVFIAYVLGSIGWCLSSSLEALLLFRFTMGIGIGLSSIILPIYLAEHTQKENRGKAVSFFQLAITLGVLFSYFVNYLSLQIESWKMPIFLGLIIAIIGGVALFLEKIDEKPVDQMKIPLFQRGLLKPLLIGIFLSMAQQFTGINTVIYYGPEIFKIAKLGSTSAFLLATLGIGFVNVFSTLIAIRWIDRAGRKILLYIGLTGMTFSLLLLSFFFSTPWISVPALMIYVAFFAMSLGPVVWVLISEIYPHAVRGRAVSLNFFINTLVNFLLSLFFLPLVHLLSIEGLFLLFALLALLTLLFVYAFLPETKGKSLTEITTLF